MTQFEQLDLLLNEYGGIIQTFQVIDNGISKPVFYSYVKERGLEQAAISLIICATGICWNQVVCKRMAGKQRLCLVMENLSETQRSK